MVGLAVIHLAGDSNKARKLGRGGDDEPRIHCDAMPTDAWTGREDVYPRVVVRQPDDLPHVERQVFTDQRKLVGESDIDVAVGILDELGHLGTRRVGLQDLALGEYLVERG